jgi:NinB protein
MLYVMPTGRANALAAVANAPEGFRVKVEPPKRSGEQNDKLHALLSEVAATREWAGQRWDVEDWKRLLTCAWMRTRRESPVMVPAVDGAGFDILYRRTSKLTKAECAELIDYIEAWLHG